MPHFLLSLDEDSFLWETFFMSKKKKLMGGALIADRLDALGHSQAWLAEAVGVPAGTVSRWVRGDREPSLPSAVRLSDVLGVDVRDLIGIRRTA